MTSTPSYPSRAAISKALAVDSGYVDAVDNATFADGTRAMRPFGERGLTRGAVRAGAGGGPGDGACADGLSSDEDVGSPSITRLG
jgi:hypothetical protein